ncbi:c-type cytochrome [Pannonibacter sp.]|uniref:c-type cytochrome n=1 Tax=Pannonibacter sp. TaxID=1906786 RepID=UPI003F71151E
MLNRSSRLGLVVAGVWLACISNAAADKIGDPVHGESLFKKDCAACHQVGEGAVNRVGPQLNGLFDRRAGSLASFSYSKGMLRMGSDGLTWTFETLDAYLANPRSLVSGTRMSYRGMKDQQDRSALMAYLRTWSDKPQNIPEASPTARPSVPVLDAAILAIQGDPAYGEYLSSECTTCHQRDGSDQGIPAITKWPQDDFVAAMHAYKQKLRPHPVMQMMATRLSDEEIAALAAYFATLE